MAPPAGPSRCRRGGQAPRTNRSSNSKNASSNNNLPHGNNPPNDQDNINPSIKLLDTKNYMNVCWLIERDHLSNNNWHDWTHLMNHIFKNCKITKYIKRSIQCPDQLDQPLAANNWSQNDSWAQQVILQNITPSQWQRKLLKLCGKLYKLSMKIKLTLLLTIYKD